MKRWIAMLCTGSVVIGGSVLFSSGHATSLQSRASLLPEGAPHTMHLTREKVEELYFAAARAGRTDIIMGLIGQGIDPNIHNQKGDTPLILATYYGHLETVNALIAHGAQPCGKDKKGNTALMGAAFKGESEIVRRLAAAGCPVDTQNNVQQTALMMASLFGRIDTVKTLLALGANPALKDASGATAAILADAQNDQEMVGLLMRSGRQSKP